MSINIRNLYYTEIICIFALYLRDTLLNQNQN